MKKNKRYTEAFKREVLEMAASDEISVAQLARDLGIAQSLIYKWWKRYRARYSHGIGSYEVSIYGRASNRICHSCDVSGAGSVSK